MVNSPHIAFPPPTPIVLPWYCFLVNIAFLLFVYRVIIYVKHRAYICTCRSLICMYKINKWNLKGVYEVLIEFFEMSFTVLFWLRKCPSCATLEKPCTLNALQACYLNSYRKQDEQIFVLTLPIFSHHCCGITQAQLFPRCNINNADVSM